MIVKNIIMSPAQRWHKTSYFPVLLLCAMTDAHFVIRLYYIIIIFSFNIFPRSLNKHGISQKERNIVLKSLLCILIGLNILHGEAHPPPHGAQILSISCSFWENLPKSYIDVSPGGLAPPPQGNPGSATGLLKHMEVRRPMSRPWYIRIQTLFENLFAITYKAQHIFTSRLHLNIWNLPSSFTGQTHNGTLSPRWSFPCDLTCWFVSTRTITAPITQVRTEVLIWYESGQGNSRVQKGAK